MVSVENSESSPNPEFFQQTADKSDQLIPRDFIFLWVNAKKSLFPRDVEEKFPVTFQLREFKREL